MMADIARLHHEMINNQNNPASGSTTTSQAANDVSREQSEERQFVSHIADRIDAEEGKVPSEGDSSIMSANSARLTQQEQKSDKSQKTEVSFQPKDQNKKGA